MSPTSLDPDEDATPMTPGDPVGPDADVVMMQPKRIQPAAGIFILFGVMILEMMFPFALLPMLFAFPHYVGFVAQILHVTPFAIAAWFAFDSSPRIEIGFRLPTARMAGILTTLALSNLFVIGFVISLFLTFLFPPEVVREQIRSLNESLVTTDTGLEKLWLVLGIVIGAPIAEELFYRGLLQNLLVRWFRPAVGIVMASFVFMLMHFDSTRFPGVFEIGLLLGYVYYRTGTIWAPILMHAVNNGTISLATVWPEVYDGLFGPVTVIIGLPIFYLSLRAFRAVVADTEPHRRLAPKSFDFGKLILRVAPFWVLAIAVSLLAFKMESDGARALREKMADIREIQSTIDERFATDAAWMEFSQIRAAVRGTVKRGKYDADVYVEWLETVRDDHTVPLIGSEPDYHATGPSEVEREVLDVLREDAERRFDVEVPPALPFY